jgi:hypothetical protein
MPERPEDDAPPAGYIAPGAMTEFLTDDWGFFVRSSRQFERFRSPFGSARLVSCSTSTAFYDIGARRFFYHENPVHVAGSRTRTQADRWGGTAGRRGPLKHPSIGGTG